MRLAPPIVAMLFWTGASFAAPQVPGEPLVLLLAGRYEELHATLQAAQDSYKRGEIGDEQLLATFRPFHDVSDPRYLRQLEEWVEAMPDSYVAHLALGIHIKYIGYEARGAESLAATPDSRLEKFDNAFRRAAAVLGDSLTLDHKPLLTYHHLIDPNGPLPRFTTNRRLLEKAIELDPGTFVVRRKFLTTLPGRWGGSLAKMERFVDECRSAGLSTAQIALLERDVEEERAYLAFRNGNLVDAERRYKELLARDPGDRKSRNLLLSVLGKRKKCDQLISLADEILRDNPLNVAALEHRGLCHVRQERFESGIADYRAAASHESPWAQMELARLHWQGRLVAKDRKLALELLRRAAESGNSDAQREFERVTGERVVTKFSSRDALIPMLWIAVPLTVAGALAVFIRGRVPAEVATRRLHFPIWRFVGAALVIVVMGGMLYGLYNAFSRDPWRPLLYLILTFVIIVAIWDAARTLLLRHEVSDDGIISMCFGRSSKLKWAEVTRVDYRPRQSSFRLSARDGRRATIHGELLNFELFARETLTRVPAEAIDPRALLLLEYALGIEEEPEEAEAGS